MCKPRQAVVALNIALCNLCFYVVAMHDKVHYAYQPEFYHNPSQMGFMGNKYMNHKKRRDTHLYCNTLLVYAETRTHANRNSRPLKHISNISNISPSSQQHPPMYVLLLTAFLTICRLNENALKI